MSAEAWLLEADGTVTPVVAVRRLLWPGTAEVTLEDGHTEVTQALNVLAGDNLELRYFSPEAQRSRERAAFVALLEAEGDEIG